MKIAEQKKPGHSELEHDKPQYDIFGAARILKRPLTDLVPVG